MRLPARLALLTLCLLMVMQLANHKLIGSTPVHNYKFRLYANLPYIRPHGKIRVGDLYIPAGDALHPAVLLLHGGGWVAGSKFDPGVQYIASRLAGQGWVVFNINYRLVRQGGAFPADLRDCKNALAWLTLHSRKYHINPKEIVVVGASAGAHLALMTAYTRKSNLFPASHYPGVTLHVAAAVGFYTPTNAEFIKFLPPQSWARRLVERYLAGWRKLHPHNWLPSASPFYWAKQGVPTLLLQGAADKLVPSFQAAIMQQALKKYDIPAQLFMEPGVGHAFMDFPSPVRRRSMQRLEKYLRRIIHPVPPPARANVHSK